MDRRIDKTHTALQNAVLTLLGKYPWERVSVQSLCDEANVSRSTFYLHYDNKDELLDHAFLIFEEQLSTVAADRSLAVSGTFSFLPKYIDHVASNYALYYQNMCFAHERRVHYNFQKMIDCLIAREIAECFPDRDYCLEQKAFIVGGMMNVIESWAAGNCAQSTEHIVSAIDTLVAPLLTHTIPNN